MYNLGSLVAPNPVPDVQTVLVPAGGSATVEFKVDVPGDYRLVDHSLSRVAKGALGILTATGKDDPRVFRALTKAAAPERSFYIVSRDHGWESNVVRAFREYATSLCWAESDPRGFTAPVAKKGAVRGRAV